MSEMRLDLTVHAWRVFSEADGLVCHCSNYALAMDTVADGYLRWAVKPNGERAQ